MSSSDVLDGYKCRSCKRVVFLKVRRLADGSLEPAKEGLGEYLKAIVKDEKCLHCGEDS